MGRGVGGGSLINGMIWNRGSQEDFDIWEQLGNPDWSWNDLLPYFRKVSAYSTSPPQVELNVDINSPNRSLLKRMLMHGSAILTSRWTRSISACMA